MPRDSTWPKHHVTESALRIFVRPRICANYIVFQSLYCQLCDSLEGLKLPNEGKNVVSTNTSAKWEDEQEKSCVWMKNIVENLFIDEVEGFNELCVCLLLSCRPRVSLWSKAHSLSCSIRTVLLNVYRLCSKLTLSKLQYFFSLGLSLLSLACHHNWSSVSLSSFYDVMSMLLSLSVCSVMAWRQPTN